MLRTRIIPCLQLRNGSLVKTVRYKQFDYIGDPANTCRIFNEIGVDELAFVDINASRENRDPDFKLLREIADECFMPLSYGGGVDSLSVAEKIIQLGFEKIILNSAALRNPNLVKEISESIGSQSLIVSIDVKKNIFGHYQCRSVSGKYNHKKSPVNWARELENLGAGELLLTSIDKEGTWSGFDVELIANVSNSVSIPVIASGGAGCLQDIAQAVNEGNASAVALGSMVLFQRKGMGVLVNFPKKDELDSLFSKGNNI